MVDKELADDIEEVIAIGQRAKKRAVADIAWIHEQDWSLKEKNLWIITIDILYRLGYYEISNGVHFDKLTKKGKSGQ